MNNKPRSRSRKHQSPRSGFTLIEMLVAVGLVLLMMTMFAQIFGMATDAVTTQRGISNNDQKARMVFTRIAADLDKRATQNLIPFFPNEDASSSPIPFAARQGYFSISTNNPYDHTDDVLSLIIDVHLITRNKDETREFGKATQLLSGAGADLNGDGVIDAQEGAIDLIGDPTVANPNTNPNQPEFDDGQVEPNGTLSSSAAEVVYFLRNGNLYCRRVAIREPLKLAGEDTQPQPLRWDGLDFFDLDGDPLTPGYPTADSLLPPGRSQNFYSDFDVSVYRTFDVATGQWSAARFHGLGALNNEGDGATFYSLGKPNFRFGHDVISGNPREFAAAGLFVGRLLHEETSYNVGPNIPDRFGYPQARGRLDENPYAAGVAWPADANGDILDPERKIVSVLQGGDRRAEDLLLTNVHEFRIEIWDERLRKFVAPGHIESGAQGVGDFHRDRRLNVGYGPQFSTANVNRNTFDTWHPQTGVVGSSREAPYRPMAFYPPGSNAVRAAGETLAYWEFDTPAVVGDRVFIRTEDRNGNGIRDAGEDGFNGFPVDAGPPTNVLDTHAPSNPFGYAYYYECVRAGQTGATNAPAWQARPGALVTEDLDVAQAGQTPAIWRAVQNLRPLSAVRITLRFIDPGTEQMRQVSITHSLTN